MSCTQTLAGIAKDCASSMGGIVEVYIANAEDVASVTATTGKVTAISMVSSAKFKKYHFSKETGSMTSTRTIDHTTGANYVSTELALVFNKMETAKRVEISALSVGELVVICKDANGAYWYLGMDEPVLSSAGDGQTGTARADRNGYTITLLDNSKDFPFEILVGEGGVDLASIVSA